MSMPKRGEISIFNIVCILAVVLIHSVSGPETVFGDAPQKIGFLIPYNVFVFVFEAFLFMSGLRLFLNRYDSMTFDTFYVNRLVLVILPYFVFSAIYYTCFCLLDERVAGIADFWTFFITGESAPDMYFVLVLAQFYLLMPLIAKLLKKANHKAVLIVSLIISIAVSYLSGIYPNMQKFFPQYILFFIGGVLSAIYYKEFKTLVREKKGIISLVFVLTLAAYEVASFLLPAEITAVIRLIYSSSAITFLFMIATALSDAYYIRNFLLRHIDKSAYFIFLIHGLIIHLTDIILIDKMGITNTPELYGLRAVSVLIVTLLVSITWRYIRNVFMLKLER